MSTSSKSSQSTVSTTANAVDSSLAIATGNIGRNAHVNLQVGLNDKQAREYLAQVNENIDRIEGMYDGARSLPANNPSQYSYTPLVIGGGSSDNSPAPAVVQQSGINVNNQTLLLLGGAAAVVAILSYVGGK